MSIHRTRLIALALSCIVPPSMVSAQVVVPGARVRVVDVSSNNPLGVGKLVRLVGDSVTIAIAANLTSSETQTVWVVGGQHRLEVRTALRRKTTIGAAIGSVAGAAIGAAIGSRTPKKTCQAFALCFPPTMQGALGGAFVGTIVGAILGHAIKSETWQRVDQAPVRVGIATGQRGILFTASVAF